jgi:membrane-anchored protein YejM (alkaline phosphatase superfamily)
MWYKKEEMEEKERKMLFDEGRTDRQTDLQMDCPLVIHWPDSHNASYQSRTPLRN